RSLFAATPRRNRFSNMEGAFRIEGLIIPIFIAPWKPEMPAHPLIDQNKCATARPTCSSTRETAKSKAPDIRLKIPKILVVLPTLLASSAASTHAIGTHFTWWTIRKILVVVPTLLASSAASNHTVRTQFTLWTEMAKIRDAVILVTLWMEMAKIRDAVILVTL